MRHGTHLPFTLFLTLVVAAAPLARAQGAAARTADTTRIDTVTVSASRLAAAHEVLRVMDMERQILSGVKTMLDAQLTAAPALQQYRDVMQAWAVKYLTWAVMGDRLARVYAQTFTERELRELTAFYRTPVGQKVARVTPALMQRGAEVGAAVAQEHMAELESMIQARARELQGRP